MRSKPAPLTHTPDLEPTLLPDLIGASLISPMARVDELEEKIGDHAINHHPAASKEGVWRVEDFSI